MKYIYSSVFYGVIICSLVLYKFCGNEYSHMLCEVCAICFLFMLFLYCKLAGLKNYYTFEILFSVAYFFVFFAYPVFIYPINKFRFFSFAFGFNETVINKSTALALIGYCFFVFGALKRKKEKKQINHTKNNYLIRSVGNVAINFFLLVVLVGNYIRTFVLHYSIYRGNREPEIWRYFDVAGHGISMAALCIHFYTILNSSDNRSTKTKFLKNSIFWIMLVLNEICILFSGKRTEPICIVLTAIAGFFLLNGGAKLNRIIVLSVSGIVILSLFGTLRSENATFSFDFLDLTMDLIVNNYTLYLAYDYVLKHGMVFFPFIGSFINIFPFVLGIVVSYFNIPISHTTSALFFTTLVLGNSNKLGLGTNIISSLFLSTGFLGVLIGMFVLGRIIATCSNDLENASMFRLLVYFEFMGSSVYLTRSEYAYPLRNIAISYAFLLLFWGLNSFQVKKYK